MMYAVTRGLGDGGRSATEGSNFVMRAYLIKPAAVAPIIASAVIIGFAFTWSPWALIWDSFCNPWHYLRTAKSKPR